MATLLADTISQTNLRNFDYRFWMSVLPWMVGASLVIAVIHGVYKEHVKRRRKRLYAVWLEWRKSMPERGTMNFGIRPGCGGRNEFTDGM